MSGKITAESVDWKQVASRFLDERYTSEAAVAEVKDWFSRHAGGPLTLPGFLQPDLAADLATALRRFGSWSRYTTAFEGRTRMVEIDSGQWATHPTRAARHYLARPLVETLDSPSTPGVDRAALSRFLGFAVTGGYLLSWLSAITDCPVEPRTSFEFSCYGQGDMITEHDDLLPGRILAANCYLDDAYACEQGGQLHFRDEQGREYTVDPVFNSFTLIPIRPGCVHWVEPYLSVGRGRFTANFQIHSEY